jgi:hypothetical protein
LGSVLNITSAKYNVSSDTVVVQQWEAIVITVLIINTSTILTSTASQDLARW